ncbi:DUF1127 domain-containing protein [Kiloniella sp.]|uniref:DUF1127 domain-containing protein n=1 Tax=Kiloniella sp. TaxID=1938587 RepID=UPI003B02D04F
MLKQQCHTLSTSGACGSSFAQDQGLESQITATNKEISTLIARAFAWVVMAFEVREERRTLAGLTGEQLKDIGLIESDVESESKRAYWDLPLDRNL